MLSCTVAVCASAILSGCDACSKTMTVTGTVTDGTNSQPLSGVSVFCCSAGELSTPKTTTAADGSYFFEVSNLGGFAGASVRFSKSGYTTADATPFTEEEASIDRCGNLIVQRSLVLSP
jgi:hypothetical protein